ncbi:penicillin-binding protein activator LpoB [Candidatus Doolittlea endobia]|uniref:Penicillin-binding protein activator LpoB n=1 Tax=Candidatus Doolittlea endobia TaxID=1778262 RepID=A0A143WSJ6_9ENTR|nr:penicillin-binding protein activator LpoB [Candidatus Doolittlea endobia]CUX96571.1 Penicillin-binding protein activator LpoB precursor [Candidatus Doolittlea endobia]
MKKRASVVLAALVLVSCASRQPAPSTTFIESVSPQISVPIHPPPATSEPMPILPKINTVDWKSSLLPLVQKMFAVEGINDGSVLLVNTMHNTTQGSMQTSKATAALTNLIENGGEKFRVIDANQLNTARQTLGLSANDNLESRSKAVGLARYLNAKYVLYSAAVGDVKQPTLNLQLILVQTGEILWSSTGRED